MAVIKVKLTNWLLNRLREINVTVAMLKNIAVHLIATTESNVEI